MDNYGNDAVFDWMKAKPNKKPKRIGVKTGRKSYAELDAIDREQRESHRAERHAKQRAEGEWKSPVPEDVLTKWNSIENDFWFQ